MTMRTIKSSEIGAFLFCQRAWWYQSQGIESSNQAELASGTDLHLQHGRRTLVTGLLRGLAWLLLLAALALLAIYGVRFWIS
jgi:hypothetical protein